VKEFFKNYTPNAKDVPPTHIFNYDETNFQDNPTAHQAFYSRKTRRPERVMDHSKTAYSVMFCCR
jgi:hypothetical protein